MRCGERWPPRWPGLWRVRYVSDSTIPCATQAVYIAAAARFRLPYHSGSSDLTTREDNHGVSKLDQRDCCCSDRDGDDGRRGSGRRRCEVPGLERRVDTLVSPGVHT